MKNYLKILSISLLLLSFEAQANALPDSKENATDGCLYKKTKMARPSGVISFVKNTDSTAYFLDGGNYVNVFDWSCSRLGKRIQIVIPSSNDSANYAFSIFTKFVGKDVANGFKKSFADSSGKSDFESSIDLVGYEAANYSSHRTDYESIYTIIYYTPG